MAASNVTPTLVVPSATTGAPYYDDYSENSGFVRNIYRPGFAVQARELTQAQTMSQVQIERFARHIFDNGSIVSGGVISYDSAISYNVSPTYGNTYISVSDYVGTKMGYSVSNNAVQMQIMAGKNAEGTEPPVLLAKALTGPIFNSGETVVTPSNTAVTIAANGVNSGLTAHIDNSVFFFNGYFVKVPAQTIVVSKYTTAANIRVGLEFTQVIVTSDQDASLLDPALGASNYQAPGADRLKIDLTLATRTLDSTDDTAFIELLRLTNGLKDQYVTIPIYSDIEDTLARRTYDQSGNYTVRPFNLELLNSSDSANVTIRLDPGKAYVYGYEFETIAPVDISVPRTSGTANVSNYDISTAYGNYVVVANTQGTFDCSTQPLVDIHCVPYPFINNANANTYAATAIGSARIRNLIYDSSSNTSNGKLHLHRAYIFNTRFTPITGNATGGTSNTIVLNNSNITANTNAYANVYIRLTNGPGSGDLRPILSYNGTTKTATVASNFSATPTTATQFSIEGTLKDSESFVIATPGSSFTANTNVSTNSKVNNDSNSSTIVAETSYNSVYFELPVSFVKANTGTNTYQYRKTFVNRTFNSGIGTITAGTGETLIGSGALSDSIKLSNYMVTVKTGSANTAVGDVLSFTSSLGASISVSGTTATLNANLPSDTFTADVVADVIINSGSETHPKIKTLISANTTAIAGGSANGTFVSSTGANSSVYLTAGQTIITNPNKIPNGRDSLYVSDIKQLKKVYDLRGAAVVAGASLTGYNDVTSSFTIDNGQNDNFYDHGRLILNALVNAPIGPLVVCYDYYDHGAGSSDGYGFFSIDSYPNVTSSSGYADIPSYTTADGTVISLRDVIDFRPVRQNASNTSPGFTLQGVRIPSPNQEFVISFDYYLPRNDMISLTKDRQFSYTKGVPSVNPSYPAQPTNSMMLYKLQFPPYVLFPSNVAVNFVENKRYTMRDIGQLDQRITNLEYYTTLNILEKSATDLVIQDANGLERSKYGIIADKFTGHEIGDVANLDYRCSVDPQNGMLRPAFLVDSLKLNLTSGSNYSKLGSLITAAFTTSPFVTQNLASTTVNLQPYSIANYNGTVTLSPDTDYWMDTAVNPTVVSNVSGTNDGWTTGGQLSNPSSTNTITSPDHSNQTFHIGMQNIGDSWILDQPQVYDRSGNIVDVLTGLASPSLTLNGLGGYNRIWNSWQSVWAGGYWTDNTTGQIVLPSTSPLATGTQATPSPVNIPVNAPQNPDTILSPASGDNVVNVAIIPYIRPSEIIFASTGLRPTRQHWSFLDSTPMSVFTQNANKLVLNGTTNFNDTPFITETITGPNGSASVALNSKDDARDGNTILYVVNTVGYFSPGDTLTGAVSGNTATVKEYNHVSGNAVSGGSNSVQLQVGAAAVDNYYIGNTINIIVGSGSGSIANIVSYNASTRTVTTDNSLLATPTTSSRYSIGPIATDRRGCVAGMFYIPQGMFRTGQRAFELIDQSWKQACFATSSGTKTYLSAGFIQTKNHTTVLPPTVLPPVPPAPTPPVPVPPSPPTPLPIPDPPTQPQELCTQLVSVADGTFWTDIYGNPNCVMGGQDPDPIAETFTIDRAFTRGLFITSVDLFFRTKDAHTPVDIELRPVVNGYPDSSNVISGSRVIMYPDQINISELPDSNNPSTYTTFVFDNPIFLSPGTEYALVVHSDSLNYEAFVGELGKAQIGSGRIISEQPYVGSFFKSQNRWTWTAFQMQDLMFRLNRCVFDTSGTTVNFNNALPAANTGMDWMMLSTNDLTFGSLALINYSFEATNMALASDSSYLPITANENYKHNQRKVLLTTTPTFNLQASLVTKNDAISPVIDLSRLSMVTIRNIVNNAGVPNTAISITNPGYNYANAANISLVFSGGTEGAAANGYVSSVANGNVAVITIDSQGSYYTGRGNVSFVGGGAGVVTTATAKIASEYDSSGGPAFARYITRKVVLNEGFDAGDIRAYITAYKPLGTEVELYCRVLSGDDPTKFEAAEYVKMVQATPTSRYSVSETDLIEYEYRPSLTSNTLTYTNSTGTYNSFRTFSIKIVLLADNPVKVPMVKDFRAIALPGTT